MHQTVTELHFLQTCSSPFFPLLFLLFSSSQMSWASLLESRNWQLNAFSGPTRISCVLKDRLEEIPGAHHQVASCFSHQLIHEDARHIYSTLSLSRLQRKDWNAPPGQLIHLPSSIRFSFNLSSSGLGQLTDVASSPYFS